MVTDLGSVSVCLSDCLSLSLPASVCLSFLSLSVCPIFYWSLSPPICELRRLVGDWEAPLVLPSPRDTAATVAVGRPRCDSPTLRGAEESKPPGRRSEIPGAGAAGRKGVLRASGRLPEASQEEGVEGGSKSVGSLDREQAQEPRAKSALSQKPLDWLSAFSWASAS